MNTNFRIFKMLALQTMACDALKDDVNDATLIFLRILMMFRMCVGLYDRNQRCVEY